MSVLKPIRSKLSFDAIVDLRKGFSDSARQFTCMGKIVFRYDDAATRIIAGADLGFSRGGADFQKKN